MRCPVCGHLGVLVKEKLVCDWCNLTLSTCCEGGPPEVKATLKCDHSQPAGGKVPAGTVLNVVREFQVTADDGRERIQEACVALADETGRVILPWANREDLIIDADQCHRVTLKQQFSDALDQLPDRALPFAEILAEVMALHAKKSKDYGSDTDPYANVRSSEDFGVLAYVGGLIRAHDKVTRLKRFAQRGELANESAEDSMLDLCVYFPIILMLYREASKPPTD